MTLETMLGLTDRVVNLIVTSNNIISEMTTYGVRQIEIVKQPSYILSWSNASASWGVEYYTIHGNRITETPYNSTIVIDANQFVLQAPKKLILEVIPWLDPLPLYSGSFEAKERGIFDIDTWVQGHGVEGV